MNYHVVFGGKEHQFLSSFFPSPSWLDDCSLLYVWVISCLFMLTHWFWIVYNNLPLVQFCALWRSQQMGNDWFDGKIQCEQTGFRIRNQSQYICEVSYVCTCGCNGCLWLSVTWNECKTPACYIKHESVMNDHSMSGLQMTARYKTCGIVSKKTVWTLALKGS